MSLEQVPLSSFKSIKVPGSPTTKVSIKSFVESKGLVFAKGSGFYELSKPEIIQLNKRILVQRLSDPTSLITGSSVQTVLGIDAKTRKSGKFMVEDSLLTEFRIFVQSTSYNRLLVGGTTFLYLSEGGTDPFTAVPATALKRAQPTAPVPAKRARGPVAPVTPMRRAAAPANSPAMPVSPMPRANVPAASVTHTPRANVPAASVTHSPRATATAPAHASAAAVSSKVEIVISFDTTASMYPCLSTVRSVIRDMLRQLTESIPGIRIGILAHGDYECAPVSYVTKAAFDYKLCDASRLEELIQFVTNVGPTVNYSFDECYEFVLSEVGTRFDWSPGAQKSLIMIGDATPHPVNENPGRLDWREEAGKLKELGIRVYSVHAMDYPNCDEFYRELAHLTLGFYLRLHQFSSISDFLKAVCFREGDTAEGTGTRRRLTEFESQVAESGRMVRNMRQLFDQLQDRAPAVPIRGLPAGTTTTASSDLLPVSPSRFQILHVDKDQPIKQFAEARGLVFKAGRGFYEFTKPEAVSNKKEIILWDRSTGDFYTGWGPARELAGIEPGRPEKQKPRENEDYVVFIQSSSYNRKLIGGQRFLYEVDTDTL